MNLPVCRAPGLAEHKWDADGTLVLSFVIARRSVNPYWRLWGGGEGGNKLKPMGLKVTTHQSWESGWGRTDEWEWNYSRREKERESCGGEKGSAEREERTWVSAVVRASARERERERKRDIATTQWPTEPDERVRCVREERSVTAVSCYQGSY